MLEQFIEMLTGFNAAEFHWLRPAALWLLLALPLIALLLYKKRGDNKEWHKVCDPELLPYVVESHNSEDKKRSWLWPLLLGLPAIVALAGPVWERVPQPVFDETAALVILLDTSRSMDAEDIKPSRMQRAKLKVLDILQQRATGQTALISYAAEPFVVSPLTNDAKTVSALVPSLSTDIMPQQGSNVSRAIEKAVELLNNAGARGNILLLSDGAQGQDLSAAINTAQQSKARISVIGIGSNNGAPIPSAGGFIKDQQGNIVVVKQEVSSLRQLASQGNGSYSNMTAGDADMLKVLSNSTPLENQLQSTELQADQWLEQGPWLLLPLLLLASLLFRRGVLSIALMTPLLLSSLSYSPTSQAAEEDGSWEWRDLFRNSEQQAAARFEQRQFDDSAQRFDNPQWKASAQYRAEDYKGAVESLSDIDSAEAHYNRGNALAKLGKTKEAIEAYDSALGHDTEHEDALYNKALLEKQQEQQESEQSQDGEQSDEQQEESDQQQQDKSDQQNSDGQESEDQQSQGQEQSEEQQSSEQQNPEEQEGEQSEEDAKEGQSEEEKEAKAEQEAEQQQELEKQFKDKSQQEVEQATQQWLRRIPDKPGNLLRNQFENEFRRRQKANPNQQSEDRPW